MNPDTHIFLSQIMAGTFDDDLKHISHAIHERSKINLRKTAAKNYCELNPNDTIRLKGLRPRQLNGNVGTVIKLIGNTKVQIKLAHDIFSPRRTFHANIPLTVPLSCVEKSSVIKDKFSNID